jgi:hypothetical protein
MTIRQLRILPPLAFGRLGSGEPMDNYSVQDNPDDPLDWRSLKPEPTFQIDEASGRIVKSFTPEKVEFMKDGLIRPVAPFLEVFAETEAGLEPLTLKLLKKYKLDETAISWRAIVANRKVERRTGKKDDRVVADTKWFKGHTTRRLKGACRNFISEKAFIDFGTVRYIKPTDKFPGIRLRFTPAHGLIYGPSKAKGKNAKDTADGKDPIPPSRAIYDRTKGWKGFDEKTKDAKGFHNETVPPSLYAVEPPAPTWLNNNVAISRGYLDDACDGFVEVELKLANRKALRATARICASPPAVVPDAMFVRTLADDLDQVINGPHLGEEPAAVTRWRAEDIVRRAYETVRFMNVAVMNGNNFKGRSALLLDSMPEEEAAGTQRAIRPVMSAPTVDTFTIMALHAQVYAALAGGATPWFERLLRLPHEVADLTDRGRRKMPALMCGADNQYLALTYRQIDIIRKASQRSIFEPMRPAERAKPGELVPRNLTAQLLYEAPGNPPSSRPETSVANCCPGLEFDFRAVWRRIFKGLELREYDSLVVRVDGDCPPKYRHLEGHRLLRIHLPGEKKEDAINVVTEITGPAASDPKNQVKLTTDENPAGLAPLEWSNALARVMAFKGRKVRCEFTKDKAWELEEVPPDPWEKTIFAEFEVRPFFDDDTAVISRALADAGELTQGLCSPWQNDYRECSCYYWASARPDYVNVDTAESGLSKGDNWLQKRRSGDYVPDDYVDSRLVHYDDLFEDWERWVRFQVKGRDHYPLSDTDRPRKDRS